MTPLTTRQAAILAFIRRYCASHGMPPTRAEIVTAFCFASPNAAQTHLKALARRGAIELTGGSSRGIRVLDEQEQEEDDSLPLIGRVAAGSPILTVANVESRHRVAPELFSPRAHYLLRVSGDSMIDAGICEGDLLAVHRTPQVLAGQIVVARIDDEVTVKRLLRGQHDGPVLVPANPDFAPIHVDIERQSFAIEGLAVGIIRRQRW